MSAGIVNFHHVNVTVPRGLEQAFTVPGSGSTRFPSLKRRADAAGRGISSAACNCISRLKTALTNDLAQDMSVSSLRISIEQRNT